MFILMKVIIILMKKQLTKNKLQKIIILIETSQNRKITINNSALSNNNYCSNNNYNKNNYKIQTMSKIAKLNSNNNNN